MHTQWISELKVIIPRIDEWNNTYPVYQTILHECLSFINWSPSSYQLKEHDSIGENIWFVCEFSTRSIFWSQIPVSNNWSTTREIQTTTYLFQIIVLGFPYKLLLTLDSNKTYENWQQSHMAHHRDVKYSTVKLKFWEYFSYDVLSLSISRVIKEWRKLIRPWKDRKKKVCPYPKVPITRVETWVLTSEENLARPKSATCQQNKEQFDHNFK